MQVQLTGAVLHLQVQLTGAVVHLQVQLTGAVLHLQVQRTGAVLDLQIQGIVRGVRIHATQTGQKKNRFETALKTMQCYALLCEKVYCVIFEYYRYHATVKGSVVISA